MSTAKSSIEKGEFFCRRPQNLPLPAKRKDVVMPCPVEGCKTKDISWYCFKCKEHLEFGIETGLFYCKCGSKRPHEGVFKCFKHKPEKATEALEVSNYLSL